MVETPPLGGNALIQVVALLTIATTIALGM